MFKSRRWSQVVLLFGLVLAAPPIVRAADFQPDPASVQRHGPAYRFPQAGWIVLHIEGEPYERGYQHGKLLAPEIAGYIKCYAKLQSSSAPGDAWRQTRTLVSALFLRKFDREYLEEMKGIADGATAAGARFEGRTLDLTDIAAVNVWPEIMTLDGALEAWPTGLEGIKFPHEKPKQMPPPKGDHCSAFAATGPATADGQIVFGHITMFGLYPSNYFNVWLDVKPAKGHRVLMQSFPGGIWSGMDYYQNDTGLMLSETTIRQTKFDGAGTPLAGRTRKAMQYADSIDQCVDIMKELNNGLYTNEWLLADAKTNEIAMFELGTHTHRLRRSSKNEWFGDTPGFYWGCNNTKDLAVRMETIPGVNGRPENMVWRPGNRDMKWLELYKQHHGKMDANFAKLAFTTPPVAASSSTDVKFTTTKMAKEMKCWALWGPPLGLTWEPTQDELNRYPDVRPLVSNPWTILHPHAPPESLKIVKAVDLPDEVRAAFDYRAEEPRRRRGRDSGLTVPAWHGTILPKTDGDIWLASAFAEYERYVALEHSLREQPADEWQKLAEKERQRPSDKDRLATELAAHRFNYLSAAAAVGDTPLLDIKSNGSDEWYRIASGKGVLVLHELRGMLGDGPFCELMDAFGREQAGKPVASADFARACVAKPGAEAFLDHTLKQPGLPKVKRESDSSTPRNGGTYSVTSFRHELEKCLIVYGTTDDDAAQRDAAEKLQKGIRRGPNITVPIKADKDVTDEEMKSRHLILIGRPDTNALVKRFQQALPVKFGGKSFQVRGETFAHMLSGVACSAANPLTPRYSVVVIAGLSAPATVQAAEQFQRRGNPGADVLVFPNGMPPQAIVAPAKDLVVELK